MTGVQTCALPISGARERGLRTGDRRLRTDGVDVRRGVFHAVSEAEIGRASCRERV